MKNKHAKKIILTLSVLMAFGFGGAAMAQAKAALANVQCPVMKKERAQAKFFADYKGQHVNFCCKSCVKRFNKDPEKYLAQMALGK